MEEGDEAVAALKLLRRLQPNAPGAQAVVWDMILRGEHLQTILTEFGLIPIVKVHAKENPDGGEGRRAGNYSRRRSTSNPSPLPCQTATSASSISPHTMGGSP